MTQAVSCKKDLKRTRDAFVDNSTTSKIENYIPFSGLSFVDRENAKKPKEASLGDTIIPPSSSSQHR